MNIRNVKSGMVVKVTKGSTITPELACYSKGDIGIVTVVDRHDHTVRVVKANGESFWVQARKIEEVE